MESAENLKIGISQNVRERLLSINGLRHKQEGDTTGWYIWTGEEWTEDSAFLVPVHVKHINEWNPLIGKYLGLPPGTRFLITSEYEDVWQDPSLLN